jgi:hypothetical protein
MSSPFPDQKTLEASLIRALKSNNGTATNSEISHFVAKDLALSEAQISQIRQGARTEFEYRLAWVRSRAKASGMIERVASGTWRLVGKVGEK